MSSSRKVLSNCGTSMPSTQSSSSWLWQTKKSYVYPVDIDVELGEGRWEFGRLATSKRYRKPKGTIKGWQSRETDNNVCKRYRIKTNKTQKQTNINNVSKTCFLAVRTSLFVTSLLYGLPFMTMSSSRKVLSNCGTSMPSTQSSSSWLALF
jgi:hypothetical protein